jgi:hypothetical protein
VISTQVFQDGNALYYAMYQTTLNDILLTKNPDYSIMKELILDAKGMSHFQEEKELVFGPLGERAHTHTHTQGTFRSPEFLR